MVGCEDDCARAACKEALAALDSGPGALTCGKLELGCTLDPETDAFDLEDECSTSLNEPLMTSPLIWECEIDGEVEVDGSQGYASTPLEGTVTLRRENPCT